MSAVSKQDVEREADELARIKRVVKESDRRESENRFPLTFRASTVRFLLGRIEALQKDAARLDWFFATGIDHGAEARIVAVRQAWEGLPQHHRFTDGSFGGGYLTPETIREAIDAARNATPAEAAGKPSLSESPRGR